LMFLMMRLVPSVAALVSPNTVQLGLQACNLGVCLVLDG
jgi:hypothetical protein